MAATYIRIHASDNVATALAALPAGTSVSIDDAPAIVLSDAIPFGHKFALVAIPAGDPVVKYGATIGRASQPIRPGAHVHVHNTESNRGRGDRAEAATCAES